MTGPNGSSITSRLLVGRSMLSSEDEASQHAECISPPLLSVRHVRMWPFLPAFLEMCQFASYICMEKASPFVSFRLFSSSEQVLSAGSSIGISVAKTYFVEFAFLQ
jgi:hypothetical protein